MRVKIKKPVIVMIVIVFALLVLFFPYIKAEYLTIKHGKEFKGLEQQTHMLNNSRYYRVLSYSKNKAKVFYVSDTGDFIIFEKDENGNWKYIDWQTIWSTSGSADGFMWPYYR